MLTPHTHVLLVLGTLYLIDTNGVVIGVERSLVYIEMSLTGS